MSKKSDNYRSTTGFRKEAMAALHDSVENEQSIEITKAEVKDDFCFYTFGINSGKYAGFKHQVTEAPGIIDEKLRKAMEVLNVHLAVRDDVFKHAGIVIEDIDEMHTHELAQLYIVHTVEIRGGDENESVILKGVKILSDSSRMKIETPKTAIDELSSYKWHNELKAAINDVRHEVKLYHFGNFTPVEQEKKEDPKQLKMLVATPEAGAAASVNFDEGKV